MQALTNRVGKQANTIAEKEEILRGESFPLNDGDQYDELPAAGQAEERISDQLVERSLFSCEGTYACARLRRLTYGN